MPMQMHMTVTGSKQGKIDGPSKKKKREKTFEIIAFGHEVTLPYNKQSAAVAGRRQHHPMKVTKSVDEASPKLYRAITTGEHLEVEVKWYRPDPDGGAAEQHYFTTKLEDAVLTSMRPHMPNIDEPSSASLGHLEDLSFIYKRVTWTVEGGGEHIDDWEGNE